MSGTIMLRCWVIGTPAKRAFTVRVRHDGVWDDVKNAIKEKKKPEFDDIASNTLDLWKVTIDRSQRSLLESEDFLKNVTTTNPLDPIESFSTVFNVPLPNDHIIIIIVQRPTYAEGSIVEELAHLRTHFWGQNRAQNLTPTAEIIDLSYVNLSRLNPLSIKALLVRKEYRIAYDTIIADKTAGRRTIFLLTGQPGIGKTFFLLYFLFRLLQERETVALQINAQQFVIFDQHGVHVYSIHAEETFSIPKGIWTLSDSSGEQQLGPCTPFLTSATHLLHTSSPSSGRWKDWVKQVSADRYIMDVWSPAELQMLLVVSNLDIARGLALFDRYGSNVRIIIDILNKPSLEAAYLNHVQVAAAKVAREFSTTFQELLELDFSSTDVSSKLFMLRPKDLVSRQPALTIPTTFLLTTLALALCRSAEAQQHAVFAMLNSHPTLRSPAAWIFENMAHVVVADSQRPRLKIYNKAQKEYFMPAPEEMTSGNSALRGIKRGFRPFYWRPRESNYEGVDSVLRFGDRVWALQYTVSRSHRAATEGLNEVHKNMNLKQQVKWHLVMIGATQLEAESARDSQKLMHPWDKTPVYACVVQFGVFDEQKLQQLQDVFDNCRHVELGDPMDEC